MDNIIIKELKVDEDGGSPFTKRFKEDCGELTLSYISVNFLLKSSRKIKKLKMYRESKNYYICNMLSQINKDIFCPIIEQRVRALGYGGAIFFYVPC